MAKRAWWVAAVAVVGVAAASGCDGKGTLDRPTPGPTSATGKARDTGHRTWRDAGGGGLPRFRIALPDGSALRSSAVRVSTEYGKKGDCATPARTVGPDQGSPSYTLFSVPTTCPVDPKVNLSPINGRHPAYRDADDIPASVASGADRVRTALGPALVFTQRYTECTQSCDTFDEHFAVITLDRPADRGHPALVLTSAYEALTRDELTRVVTKDLAAR